MIPLHSDVAVIIPCHNEAASIEEVVAQAYRVLPGCTVVIADNGSTDETAAIAATTGATVLDEPRLGKGYAVRRLFSSVEANAYVLIDGDNTYDLQRAPDMLATLETQRLDMVVGTRVNSDSADESRRRGHKFGNWFLSWTFRKLFGLELSDALSGYRVMSRRFVKTFPSNSVGFEIETDINVHAAVLGSPLREVPGSYSGRSGDSNSKLRTYRDGWRILRRTLRLFRDGRPALAFFMLGLPWLAVSAALMTYVFDYYFSTGLVLNFPSLIAGVGSFLVFLNLWISGLILARISRNRDEAVRLAYLSLPGSLRVPVSPTFEGSVGRGHGASPQMTGLVPEASPEYTSRGR